MTHVEMIIDYVVDGALRVKMELERDILNFRQFRDRRQDESNRR